MAGEKTEKATPKKKADSRKKGQVGKSADLQGAVVLMAGLLALSAFAPRMYEAVMEATRHALALVATPQVVDHGGIGERRGVAKRAELVLGDLAQDSAHDFS